MTKTLRPNRRQLCLGLAALPLVSACSTGSMPVSRPARTTAGARRTAVLLPLSGKRAALGKTMAKAIWLTEDLGGAQARSLILDAGESPEAAAGAAREAKAQGADVLVGPLFRTQVPAVLAVAGTTPVLSLSNDNGLAGQGAWVFGVTPAQSVQAVLRYAKSSGARRITMLETTGALGERARTAFAAGARQAGARMLPAVPGATKSTDMAAALRRAGGDALPDIIYVPQAGRTALAQAVAAVQTGVTTIGSMQWSGLPAAQFAALDKACFTGPDPQRFDRLSDRFRAQLDEDMGVIGALAVDAVAFAQSAGRGADLAQRKPVDGLLGPTRFGPNRVCDRALSILRISGGGVSRVA